MRRLIALVAVLALTLAACSGGAPDVEGQAGGGNTAQPSDGAAAGSEAAPDAQQVSCAVGEIDGELVLYNWTEYIDPGLIGKFRDEFGVDVIERFYPSNEEMLAWVQGGGSGVDVVVPSDYMVGLMVEQGLLLRLDKSAIPNAENVADDFMSPAFDPDLTFSMPYQWGTTGIGLNVNEIAGDPEATWGWIFDAEKADQLSGRISMLDDPREAMAAALSYLGYSINSTDDDELREAADLIGETASRLAAFDSEQYEDLLLGGDTAVAHGYSGDFLVAFGEAENSDDYVYVVPEEGGVRWVDHMAILADAPHPCTAHSFVNFILDARNGAQLTNFNRYGSPNTAAEEFVEADVLDDPGIYPPEDVLANLEFLESAGDAEKLYSDLFSEAKR